MPHSLEGHERRISKLEERDSVTDRRFNEMKEKIDENERKTAKETQRLFNSINDIKTSQHSQELVNQKMNFTLDSIHEERMNDKKSKEKLREESKNDVKKVKWWSLGMIGTILTSLIVAALRMWIGV